MASASIFCDPAGVVAHEVAQLLLRWRGPKSSPLNPTPQATQQDLSKQVVVHLIHVLLPWTEENVTFIGHEEKVKDS